MLFIRGHYLFSVGKSLLQHAGCGLLHKNIFFCFHHITVFARQSEMGKWNLFVFNLVERKITKRPQPFFFFFPKRWFLFIYFCACDPTWKESKFQLITLCSIVTLLDRYTTGWVYPSPCLWNLPGPHHILAKLGGAKVTSSSKAGALSSSRSGSEFAGWCPQTHQQKPNKINFAGTIPHPFQTHSNVWATWV